MGSATIEDGRGELGTSRGFATRSGRAAQPEWEGTETERPREEDEEGDLAYPSRQRWARG
jgi:hypothetical protein